jgi:PAS domain S-box-containing protein
MQTLNQERLVTVNALDFASYKSEIIRVLYVDDDASILEISKQILQDIDNGLDIDFAYGVDEAFEKLASAKYDVVVSDYEMPIKNGLDFLKELKEKGNEIPFILFTGKGREEIAIKALNLGADGYFNKQGSPETVYGELAHGIKITAQRKKAEETILKAKLDRERTFNSVPDFIAIIDNNYKIVRVNEPMAKQLGVTPERAVGLTCYECVHDTRQPPNFCPFTQTIADGQEHMEEVHEPRLGGDFLVSTTPLKDAQGNTVGSVHVARNISERKKAEEALRKSEATYRELANFLPELVFETDLTGKFTFVNERATELTSYAKNELEGKNMLQFLVPEEQEKAIENIKKVMAHRNIGFHEYTLVRKNGTTYPALVRTSPITLENRVIGLRGVVIDITERKEIEEKLIESEEKYRDLFENARENQQKFSALFSANPEAAVFLDTDLHVIEANPRFSMLFGYSLDEIKGKVITDVIVPDEAKEESKMLRQKILSQPVEIVTSRKRKDGSQVPLFMSGGSVFVDGKVIGSVMVYKDISDIITVQDARSKALSTAELLNEKLSIVGGFVRHDVRNKLSAINGNVYLAKKQAGDNVATQKYLDQIKLSSDNIVRILDFAKTFESLGNEKLALIDVGAAFAQAVSLFTDLKGVKIVSDCKGFSVLSDSMLTTIFHNLIDNSMKYGEKLTQIKVYTLNNADGSGSIVYEDDGIGIDSETKKHLFEKGFGKGTGLGLYLIKKATNVYGWKIEETGMKRHGARFVMTIPKTTEKSEVNHQVQS